jgi:hypothetical protein
MGAEIGMLVVETIAKIRRAYFVHGQPIKAICRDLGVSRKVVRKVGALWEIGDVTLPDLAERYSVHTRTLQAYFAKHKVEKGSKAAALATSVKEEIYSIGLGDKDLTIQRALETREAAYNHACVVEGFSLLKSIAKNSVIGRAAPPKPANVASRLQRTSNVRGVGCNRRPL